MVIIIIISSYPDRTESTSLGVTATPIANHTLRLIHRYRHRHHQYDKLKKKRKSEPYGKIIIVCCTQCILLLLHHHHHRIGIVIDEEGTTKSSFFCFFAERTSTSWGHHALGVVVCGEFQLPGIRNSGLESCSSRKSSRS